jgi:hypothetical protein
MGFPPFSCGEVWVPVRLCSVLGSWEEGDLSRLPHTGPHTNLQDAVSSAFVTRHLKRVPLVVYFSKMAQDLLSELSSGTPNF